MMSSLEKMDRISELPEPILHHILFFMPTEDAARTSVLSKRWKITWYSLPKYQFCFNKELYEKQEDFMDCVGKALSILGKQKVIIETFNLSMIVSRNGSCASCVNHWIELASRNYIKVLALDFKIKSEIEGIDQYRLPDTTNVESIASLTLSNCELKSPLFCSFLKDLSLTNVSVCDKQIVQNLLSNCSVLQSFHIKNCLGVKKLRLNHLRLKEATFKGVRDVDIEAVPNLEKLEYTYSRGPSNLEVIDDCNNLKELTLGSLFMPGHEIQQHVSKFTSLETLKLEISFVLEKLQISIAHLKSLSFLSTDYEYLRELDIDCPNLCEFKCSSMVIPSVLSINAACLEDVTINIMPHGSNIHPQWFLHLRKYIAEFKQVNCLELSIPDQSAFSLKSLRYESIPPPTKLKQLKVKYIRPSQDYTALIDGLLWSSYPEVISIRHYTQQDKEFITFLYNNLEYREQNPQCCNGSHIKCWRHYLKAFKYESSSPLSFETGKDFKFVLTWEFTG